MNKVLKIIGAIFLVVAVVINGLIAGSVKAVGPVVGLSLSPATGDVGINQETNIAFKMNPQGRSVVGLDITFEFISDFIDITNVVASNGFNKIEVPTNVVGMKRYSFANLGNPVTTDTTVATITLKGVALQQAVDVMLSNAKVALSDGSSLTFTNGGVSLAKGSYNVGQVVSPSPSPPPPPEKPAITAPVSGANFIIGADSNSNRPEFRWSMMGNPSGGRIKQMGIRVIRAFDDPNSTISSLPMNCSGQVMVDQWWYSRASADNQSRSSITTCSDLGTTSVSSEANSSDLVAQSFDFTNNTNPTFRPTGQLSPGKYFVTVFNFDTTYRADSDTVVNGVDTSPNNNFTSSHFFKVSCPTSTPVWDSTGSRCIAARTQWFALSEDPSKLKDENTIKTEVLWWEYKEEPIPYTFSNAVPGQVRTLFVRFKDEQGNVTPPFNKPPFQKSIKYIGADPTISNLSCGFNSDTGVGSKITITGDNFGDTQGKGKIAVTGASDSEVQVASWSRVTVQPEQTTEATSSSTPASTSSASAALPTRNRVVLKLKNKIDGSVNVTLTTDDGRQVTKSCVVDTNTVTFTVQTQCRAGGNFTADNVRVQIFENVPGARPLFDSKTKPITLDAAGLPQWTPPPLEVGKSYTLIVKAPKTLAVKRVFTVEEGTNVLDDILLPVGDIAPSGSPDGVINAVDKAELIRQWAASTDVARTGDFNLDGRINSLDYSCMRANINKPGEQFVR